MNKNFQFFKNKNKNNNKSEKTGDINDKILSISYLKSNKLFTNKKNPNNNKNNRNIENNSNEDSPIKIISPKPTTKINTNISLSSLVGGININDENINMSYNNDLTIIISIIKYLSYEDLLKFQNINKEFYSLLSNRKTRKEYILNSSIENKEHLLFYESNISIKVLQKKLVKELTDYKITTKIYQNILLLSQQYSKTKSQKENTQNILNPNSYSNVLEEIKRDINRTFYTEKFKKGNGKKMLINVLSALAFIRPEIGYCQGMNFIAGALIELIEEEEEEKIFWIFLSFIDDLELNMLFLTNMPDYSIRVYQLNFYIKKYFPELFLHFKKNQINPDIFFSKWILTIFSNYLPFNILYKIWDLFIIDKWKAIFRISMILLGLMKEKLIKLDLNEFCLFFKSKEIKETITFKYITENYRNYKITNKDLSELKEAFFIDKVKEKLEDKGQEWDIDQKEFVVIYKKELKNHELEMKEKIFELKKRIEKNNKKYDEKYQKYMKQLNIVKNLKLQLETKIEVKTGYEKVLQRNTTKNIMPFYEDGNKNKETRDNNNNYEKCKNINIGININVNHNINEINNNNTEKKVNCNNNENGKNEQNEKNKKINVFNNNNIYVNNINIINPNNFPFTGGYQINNFNNQNNCGNKGYKNQSSSTERYMDNFQQNNIRKAFSFKKLSKFNIFGKNKNELDKIQAQINNLEKEIDSINKSLIKSITILDKDKSNFDKVMSKKNKLKNKFDELINSSQKYKNDLLKNLSEKLKLSVKFVSTNKY